MLELDGNLRLHEEFHAGVVHIGNERSPLLVVDNFLRDPKLLVEYAASRARFVDESATKYPGVRAPIPQIYTLAVRSFLGVIIADAFQLGTSQVEGELAYFSLVTTRPEQLQPRQRIPHFDYADVRQLAVLHYLSATAQGGTSFYRHRATGFETVHAQRVLEYRAAVDGELTAGEALPAQYIGGDNRYFQRYASVQGVFNRIIVYRSAYLHSPDIPADFRFDADPRSGRLTANLFLQFSQ